MSILVDEHPLGTTNKIHHVFLMSHKDGMTSNRRDRQVQLGAGSGTSQVAPERSPQDSTLIRALKRAGYQVTESRSPLDSRRLLQKVRPSVLVLDPIVCAADGVEFEIAADLQESDDPIPLLLLISDLAELEEINRVPALFKDFLVKPFSEEELIHRLELLLHSKERFLEVQTHARSLEGQIIRDFKTGLYTDRHFRHLLRQEFQRAERHHSPLTFLLIDLDDFKRINDSYEYSFGDYVLTQFAEILKRSIRDIDHPARFGGDEFMVLLPNTTQAEAVQVAARLRNQVAAREFDNGTYHTRTTLSIGVDTYDGRGMSSPEDLRRRANLALKEAKQRGKDRIWLYSGPEVLPDRKKDQEQEGE